MKKRILKTILLTLTLGIISQGTMQAMDPRERLTTAIGGIIGGSILADSAACVLNTTMGTGKPDWLTQMCKKFKPTINYPSFNHLAAVPNIEWDEISRFERFGHALNMCWFRLHVGLADMPVTISNMASNITPTPHLAFITALALPALYQAWQWLARQNAQAEWHNPDVPARETSTPNPQ